jgi:hypothetical protein
LNRFTQKGGRGILPSSLGGAGRAEEKDLGSLIPGGYHPYGFLAIFTNQRVQATGEGIPDDREVPLKLAVF